MEKQNYKLALHAAQTEMSDLLQERNSIDARLGQLKQTIEGLSGLIQEPAADPVAKELFSETGISDAIRALLHASAVPLSPVQIKTELWKRGFDFSEYANAMAVIHNTLKRLDRQGELMTVRDASGQVVAYTTRFVGPGSADRSGMLG